MPITPLAAEQVRRTCNPAQFRFQTTAELPVSYEILGQERAIESVEFGVGIRQPGYNLFVVGTPGLGRRTMVERLLQKETANHDRPGDWVYVNNFADPQRPLALGLPAGRGIALRDDVAQWITELREAIPAAFDTDEYRDRLGRLDGEFAQRQQHAFETIGEASKNDGIALLRTPAGFSFAPLADGEVMNPEQFGKLTQEEQQQIAEKIRKHEAALEEVARQIVQWRRERAESLRELNEEVVEYAVGRITAELHRHYEDLPAVLAYLDAARADVIAHIDDFRKPDGTTTEVDGVAVRTEADFGRYRVNAIVSNDPEANVPVVYEDNPTYPNLVGRVEHVAQMGTLVTNFTLIRGGALHRANGGFLLIDVEKMLQQPYAWEGLKRALRTHEIRSESLGQVYSMVSTLSLEPEPIPLSVKVVLFGPPMIYSLLEAYDADFGALFKASAEFAEEMPWDDEAPKSVARLISNISHRRGLRPFTAGAVAMVVEEAARLAGDSAKLTVRVRSIQEMLQEADYRAGQVGHEVVNAEDVEAAVRARIERSAQTRDRLRESVLRDIIMIDTDGAVAGQVNGLAVYSIGRTSFGMPQRITATTRFGRGEVVDIQREIALSGAIHSKGVLTLASFVATRFGRKRGLSLSATLSFEQTYGMIDGDSASVAELCALLSSLSGVPLRQDCAITGSTNQHGQVQAIGGVNEKVEGFYDICRARGLTGRQTVIIPASNREHLMLRTDVVDAIREGRFHVVTVTHVDEALELLTEMPAGTEDVLGNFPRDSVNGRAAQRLAQYEAAGAPRRAAIGGGKGNGRRSH